MHANTRTRRNRLDLLAGLIEQQQTLPPVGALHLGVDLGTANIVVVATDDRLDPVAGAMLRSSVVRDGVVVDWAGATNAVTALTRELERRLGTAFHEASVVVPPGMDAGTVTVFSNVLEDAGLATTAVVDEPVAAATALGVRNGAVIDVGGGSTGVSLLRDGVTVFSIDEATGGHHMNLVISGATGLDYDRAEEFKVDPANAGQVFGLVRPTLEKMATIAATALAGHDAAVVHLVGGSCSFPRAAEVFADVLGRRIERPAHPLLPTPLGAAMWRSS